MTCIDPKNLGKVVVIYGGISREREVSLMSGSAVVKALEEAGVDVGTFDPKTDALEVLQNKEYSRAFCMLHGRGGEDGIIQGVLEYLQLPYTGCGIQASSIAIDKNATKVVWQAHGIPVPRGMVLRSQEDCKEAISSLGRNLIIKPSKEGSSIGLYRLENTDDVSLLDTYKKAQERNMDVLCEELVAGRELTVALLDRHDGQGLKALPIVEIRAPEGKYDYDHKYFSDETQYLCPAPIDADITIKIQETCEKAAKVLGVEGWGRIDVILRDDGSFVLLEVNTAPGMTPHSLVPLAARTVGINFTELVLTVAQGASLKA
ncbi:MAG: D-alanine--D-alanine ligase [Burkholderiaceae bacterium]|nr:D-alanine--D-alanine ligase [Burkholderiaceae bacterium]